MLNQDQFLPGMENMRHAEPYEQTHEQFLNRPDVFVHGRPVRKDKPLNAVPNPAFDFHAGTRKAALDRVHDMGALRGGDEQHVRFFAGQVDPRKMENRPPEEGPHHHPGQVVEKRQYGGSEQVRVAEPAENEWRLKDQWLDWGEGDLNHYYRNEAEDPGSTSVILHGSQRNFRSWRGQVSQAIREGKTVPSHVRSAYEASGGSGGSKTYFDAEYKPTRATLSNRQEGLFSPGQFYGSKSW